MLSINGTNYLRCYTCTTLLCHLIKDKNTTSLWLQMCVWYITDSMLVASQQEGHGFKLGCVEFVRSPHLHVAFLRVLRCRPTPKDIHVTLILLPVSLTKALAVDLELVPGRCTLTAHCSKSWVTTRGVSPKGDNKSYSQNCGCLLHLWECFVLLSTWIFFLLLV